MTAGTPPPGSDAAVAAGCLCPVLDNGHGVGARGGIKDEDGNHCYWISDACPLHGEDPEGHPPQGDREGE